MLLQLREDGADLKRPRIEHFDKVEEDGSMTGPGRGPEATALIGMSRVRHRFLDVHMPSPLEQAIDALAHLGMGRDVKEIGIELVELLFAGDHPETVGIGEVCGPWSRIEAINAPHAEFQSSMVDQLADVAVNTGDGQRGRHPLGRGKIGRPARRARRREVSVPLGLRCEFADVRVEADGS